MHVTSGRTAEWRSGWRVVLACALGIGTGAALYQYVASLFIAAAQAELGWSRGDFSLIGATPLVGALVSAPFVGRAADRFGVRPVALAATLVLIAAFVGLSRMGGSVTEAVGWMLLLGIAVPGTTGIVYSRAVTGWFVESRGLALGIMTSGVSIGALLAGPLVAWGIARDGLAGGYLTLALLAACIGLPAILLGLRERERVAPSLSDDEVDDAPPMRALLGTRRFWLLAGTILLVNIPSAGILTQLAPLLSGRGVASHIAPLLLSLYALSVIVGRIAIGWLFDRLSPAHVAAGVTMLAALGCIGFHSATPLPFVYAGVVTVGLMQGAETDVVAYFIARMFDHRRFGSVYGLQVAFGLVGTAAGVIGFGQLYDAFDGYDQALLIGAAMLLVVAGLYLACTSYLRRDAAPSL